MGKIKVESVDSKVFKLGGIPYLRGQYVLQYSEVNYGDDGLLTEDPKVMLTALNTQAGAVIRQPFKDFKPHTDFLDSAGNPYADFDAFALNLAGVISVSAGGSGGGIPEAPEDGKAYARLNGEWQLASLQRVAEASVNNPSEIAKSNIQIAVESDTASPGSTVTSTIGYDGISYVNAKYDFPSEGDYSFASSNLVANAVVASSLVSLSGIESNFETQISSPNSVDKIIIESTFDSNIINTFILDDVSNVGVGTKTIKFPQVAVGDTEVLAIEP